MVWAAHRDAPLVGNVRRSGAPPKTAQKQRFASSQPACSQKYGFFPNVFVFDVFSKRAAGASAKKKLEQFRSLGHLLTLISSHNNRHPQRQQGAPPRTAAQRPCFASSHPACSKTFGFSSSFPKNTAGAIAQNSKNLAPWPVFGLPQATTGTPSNKNSACLISAPLNDAPLLERFRNSCAQPKLKNIGLRAYNVH